MSTYSLTVAQPTKNRHSPECPWSELVARPDGTAVCRQCDATFDRPREHRWLCTTCRDRLLPIQFMEGGVAQVWRCPSCRGVYRLYHGRWRPAKPIPDPGVTSCQ